ncbi:MAG: hypothetical protein IT329_03020 [Caldilineaceae bacterium]|nr:hypothetical protein [Caldilineaceae bacterium]
MTEINSDLSVRQEIASLRAAVERLEAARPQVQLRLRVDAPAARIFLGQPVAILARGLLAGGQTPAANLPITFMTSWGTLRGVGAGYIGQIGASVTTLTGLDGVARVTLLPPGADLLDVAQQSALRTALDRLDPNAATPADLQAQLGALVNDYRWEANLLLRQAVDILYRANGAPPLDAIHPEDALAAWRQVNATVVAIAGGEPIAALSTGGEPIAAASAAVRVLDWLPPWLQLYIERTQTDATLPRQLERAGRRAADPHTLIDGVYREVNQYVDRQLGEIGQVMGQRSAESALRTFAQKGLAELSAAARVELFPALRTASETVATAGVQVLGALGQGRADLRQEVGAQVQTVDSRLGGRIGSVEQALTGKADAGDFQGFRSEIGASLAALDGRTQTLATQFSAANALSTTLQGQLAALQSSFGQLTVNVGTLQDSLGQLSGPLTDAVADLTQQLAGRATAGDLASLQTTLQAAFDAALQQKADLQVIDTLRADLTNQLSTRLSADDLAAFQTTFQAGVDMALQQKADSQAVDTLRSELSAQLEARLTVDEFKGFQQANDAALAKKANAAGIVGLRKELAAQIAGKADQAALDAFRQDADGRFAELVANAGQIAAQLSDVNRSLADINDRFGGLHNEFTAQLDANQQSLAQALTMVTQLQGTVGELSTDFTARLAGVEAQTQGVTSSLADFQKSLSGLNRDFTRLNKNIIDAGLLRPPP